MKKKIVFTALFTLFVIVFTHAQFHEDNWLICNGGPPENDESMILSVNCNRTSPLWQQSNRMYFVPDSTHPSFIVPLNIIVVRKTNGTGNFPDSLAQQIFPDVIDLLNYHYDNLVEIDPINYDNCFDVSIGEPVYTKSIKIQFILDTILYVDSTDFWGLTTHLPTTDLINYVESILGTNSLNVYFTMQYQAWECFVNQNLLPDSCNEGSGYVGYNEVNAFPSETNMNNRQYIVAPNKYAEFIFNLNKGWTLPGLIHNNIGRFARIFEHELGHIFGLGHASISSHYILNQCVYSIMHQAGSAAAKEEPWLPPSEIGEMHRRLHTSSVRQYVPAYTYFPNQEYFISDNQTWNHNLRLYSDLIIQNNSTLTLQCSLYMPEFGDIIVNPGCTLVIDESALLTGFNDNWQGTIHVKENARLIIRNGGTIKMGNNGSILVDYANGNAGLLEYKEGANLILDSNTTKLEIKGNLYIDDNSNFTIQGKGYVLFNSPLSDGNCYNVSSGTNTSFTLQGENQNHKKLEISQPSLYIDDVKNISITDAKVTMTGNISRLSLHYASSGSISIDNVLITTSTGNKTNHRGIALYGQSNISIGNSVFRNGMYGIHAMLNFTDGAPLTLTNCAFYNNDRGINVNSKGITLNDCTFDGNGYGVYADGMTFSSTVNNSSVIYSTNDGINYISASTGGLNVLYPLIMYNSNNGIAFSGATKLTVRCGQVRSNLKGITFSNNASLNMSENESPIGGRVRMMVNTENNIYASNGNLLFLNAGYNNLQRNTNKKVITGNLGGYSACPTYLTAQNNRWNSSNLSPVYNTDYTLVHNVFCRRNEVYLTDNSPTYGFCNAPSSLSMGDNSFANSSVINTQNYNGITLSNALSDAVSLIENAQHYTASDRLFEILNYPLLSTSTADDYYLNKAYLYMKENMAYILQDLVSDTTLTAQNTLGNHVGQLKHIQNNIITQTQNDTNAYNRYYYASLDKALLYRAIYDYDNALLYLKNILSWVKPQNTDELNKWICLTQLEKDVLDSIVRKEDFFELKQLCEYSMQLKMASDDNNEIMDNEESEPDNHNLNIDEPYITVTPNPVTNQSLINVYVPELKGNVVIRIFDVLGTLHKEIKITEIQSNIRIGNTSFKDGIYQFVLMQGNNILDNVRVVFVKD